LANAFRLCKESWRDTVTARVSDKPPDELRSQALSLLCGGETFLAEACKSTNNLEAASPSVSGPEMALENPARVAGQNRTGWERRYQRRQLQNLMNRLLAIWLRLNDEATSNSGGGQTATA